MDAAMSRIARCGEDEGAEPRFRAAARYNAGIAHFIGGDHDNALLMLGAARELEAEVRRVHGGGEGEAHDEGRLDPVLSDRLP